MSNLIVVNDAFNFNLRLYGHQVYITVYVSVYNSHLRGTDHFHWDKSENS